MAQPPLSKVVDQLRRTIHDRPGETTLTDSDLLNRFIQQQDHEAFRRLVVRHGKTVLAACRQVLTDSSDVDDAFQATFLVLLKKAKRVDPQLPLSGWLFGVAHRVAVRCRADAQRRKAREAEAAKRRPKTMELADLTWREAAAALHEELNRLSDRYRLPLLLCCVQGLSRDEAAASLGTTLGAIRGQLERGRKRLERRLRDRGITLSAGLFSILFGSSAVSGTPTTALIHSTILATCGHSTAAVAALAKGALPMMSIAKSSLYSIALLVGLVSLTMRLDRGEATANAEPTQSVPRHRLPEGPKRESKQEEKDRLITGTVVDAGGTPIEAELSIIWMEGKPLSLGKCNADGTFKVSVPFQHEKSGGWLVAQAPGYGFDFLPHGHAYLSSSMTPTVECRLQLSRERIIKGRILDREGKPVAASHVWVAGTSNFDNEASERRRLTTWATEDAYYGGQPRGDRDIIFHNDASPDGGASPRYRTKTDAEGRFKIHGLGVGQLIKLKIRGSGIADEEAILMNREGFNPQPWNDLVHQNRISNGIPMKYAFLAAPDPVVVVEPEKIIRGTLTDHQGKPRVGVQVVFSRTEAADLNLDYNWAITDRNGKYEIRGARKHKSYMIECPPDKQAGLMECQGFAQDTPGYDPVEINLKCRRGVVVTGTVRDKATGKPLPGMFYVSPLANNSFVTKFPPFLHRASIATEANRTDEQGRFRVVTIPGPVILTFGAASGDYRPIHPDPDHPNYFTEVNGLGLRCDVYPGANASVFGDWCKIIETKETDVELKLDVELEPATRHPVKVTDLDGKPLFGIEATGITHEIHGRPKRFADTDTLAVLNLEPKQARLLAVYHPEKKLVGTLKLASEQKNPTVKLGPGGTIIGRVVDEGGKPMAKVRVDLTLPVEVRRAYEGMNQATRTETDEKGLFRFTSVFPEVPIAWTVYSEQFPLTISNSDSKSIRNHGELLDVGDLVVRPKKE